MKILIAALLAAASLLAQGQLNLQILDASGAPTPASGTLNNRRFETAPDGKATFPNLPFGRYQLNIEKPGFAPANAAIDIQSSQPVSQTLTLRLAVANSAIEVVDATPLPGLNLTLAEIPNPVQLATAADFRSTNSLDLSDLLNRRLRGVHINELQGNPVQPDLNYRGYTASPLLGTPQGVSIYFDGVRLNQPFGDIISWDLIPRIAIAEMSFMPGSNPLFGLNTLGGALAIETKSGLRNAGSSLQLSGGSFGRKIGELEHGGAFASGFHYYLASTLLFEDGWRDSSPTNVRQFFGKFGRQRAKTSVNLALSYANNHLNGNGLGERRDLARRYESVYTKPDINTNRSPFAILSASRVLSPNWTLSGNAWLRHIRNATFNGDLNDDALDQSLYQLSAADQRALTAAGYTGFPTSGATAANTPFPFWRCIAQVLQVDEPAEKCNGIINTSRSQQASYGASGQLNWARGKNHFTAGGVFDRNQVAFNQASELGYINPDRSISGTGAFADGVSAGEEDGEPFDTRVDLRGRTRTASVFATAKTAWRDKLHLTLSGRYNHTHIDNRDRIFPGPARGSLTGKHNFGRFNPAAGLTYSPNSTYNFYFSYAQASRAPTSIELGCADPEAPCKLPNAMVGDPPLQQVVTHSWEAGIRGSGESRYNWSAGFFHADNSNDILFVAAPASGYGYFKNFGHTRRQGAEFDFNARLGRLTAGAGYTFLDATYQSPETVQGDSNSLGINDIKPGYRIPLIPHHLFKAYADLAATSKLTLNLGVIANSSSFARGNENNAHQPDNRLFLGPGASPGYGIVNLGGRYQLHPKLAFFANVNNLFDKRYYSAAQLGPTGFADNGNFIARPLPAVDGEFPIRHATFFAPGAPRGAWAGLRLTF